MKQSIKILALILALLMVLPLSLLACKKTDDTDKGNPEQAQGPDKDLEIKIYALNGTTSMGMAQMIAKEKDGTDTMNYKISLHAAADAITGAITSGECAIAALPTNAAANLYKKSEGKIQLLALNTLGVLYLLDTTGEVKSLTDLKGKTVYLPGAGSNPEFITAALLEAANLKVGEDVTLDTTSYNSPDALQAAIIAGKAAIAVLPEPKVSVVTSQAKNATVALDLTAEWEKINGKNTLVQGCLVVNKKFAEEHPAELAQFLKDYEASVNFIKNGSDEAVNMIVDAGILPKAPIAKKALPKCNLCFIAGEDMKPVMTVFCQKMNAVNKKAVAAVPDDGFYYVAK